MKSIIVKASKTYEVKVGNGLLDRIGQTLKEKNIQGRIAVISDKKVFSLYGNKLISSLNVAGYDTVAYTVKGGEGSKSGKDYLKILEFLAKNQFTRTDTLIAHGGGVVGDLTGFIAGTYLRGIKFIQVPTTLLAFADSSVGGKTAINLKSGKNLVGVFNQPEAVICDIDVIKTLSKKDYACGMAEIIKYGMIFDEELLELLQDGMENHAEEIIARCIDLKRIVVEKDERDNGDRQLLNFGHTLAHAIEKASKFRIAHGQAVAVGMHLITERAVEKGLCEKQVLDKLESLLVDYDLPVAVNIETEELFEITLVDKKRKGDEITVVMPEKLGKCYLKKMSVNEWKEFIL